MSDIPEVRDAIAEISNQLFGITHQQRLELLRLVNDKIKEVESIRKPAYEIAQFEMKIVYKFVTQECGSGCSTRMASHLEREAPKAIDRTRQRVHRLITKAVNDLVEFVVQTVRLSCRDFELKLGRGTVAVTERGAGAIESIVGLPGYLLLLTIDRGRHVKPRLLDRTGELGAIESVDAHLKRSYVVCPLDIRIDADGAIGTDVLVLTRHEYELCP